MIDTNRFLKHIFMGGRSSHSPLLREDRMKLVREMFKFSPELTNHLHQLFGRHLFIIAKMLYIRAQVHNSPVDERYTSIPKEAFIEAIRADIKWLVVYNEQKDITDDEILKSFDDRHVIKSLSEITKDTSDVEYGYTKLLESIMSSIQIDRGKEKRNNPDQDSIMLRRSDGSYWLDLGKSECPEEAASAHHCGTATSDRSNLISLRDRKHRTLVTVEYSPEIHGFIQAMGPMNKPLAYGSNEMKAVEELLLHMADQKAVNSVFFTDKERFENNDSSDQEKDNEESFDKVTKMFPGHHVEEDVGEGTEAFGLYRIVGSVRNILAQAKKAGVSDMIRYSRYS